MSENQKFTQKHQHQMYHTMIQLIRNYCFGLSWPLRFQDYNNILFLSCLSSQYFCHYNNIFVLLYVCLYLNLESHNKLLSMTYLPSHPSAYLLHNLLTIHCQSNITYGIQEFSWTIIF